MTKEELKQIFYLNKEVIMWQKELDRIQCKSLVKSQAISSESRGAGGVSDNVGDTASEIADIKLIIEGKLKEIQLQRKRIIEYIDRIADTLVRQIVFYRHVSLMSWVQVAVEIGGGNTADGVRKTHDRFFSK